MKKLLPLLLLFALTNCKEKKQLTMDGAYLMRNQLMNSGSKDSAINRRQMKIYTKDHVIYAAMRFPDSLASYAIGTYDIDEDGKVIEHFYYSSANGAQRDTFILNVEKTDTGYKQTIKDLPSQGKKYTLIEQYQNVGKSDSTYLDGTWRKTQNFYVDNKGDTSSRPNYTDFKVYQKGNFIWAASYPDSTKKLRTFFGYGKFQMDGPNKSKEINSLSTYPPLIDSTNNIELEFIGTDFYKQTILQPGGGKSIELYVRLKKED